MTFTCWPDTQHPHYADQASAIRSALGRLNDVVIFDTEADSDSALSNVKRLTVRKAAGPAPYVGDPFVYVWRVALDDEQQWVAGPAEIQPTGRYLLDA